MTSDISKKKKTKKQELQELPQSQPLAISVAGMHQPVTELEQPQSLPSVTELEQPQPLAISVMGMQPHAETEEDKPLAISECENATTCSNRRRKTTKR